MLERFTTTITPLGRERQVQVYLPSDHATCDERYPVLYMHDGQNLFVDADATHGTSWGVADHLEAHGPALIVVGIESPRDETRIDEYTPWPNPAFAQTRRPGATRGLGGEGWAYVEWIVEELKPAIDARYRTRPAATAMAGSSLGGLISLYAACVYPSVFRRIASVSSAFWFNQAELEDLIRASDLSALERVYLDVGTDESTDPDMAARYLRSSDAVHALLAGKVDRLRYDVVPGGEHHESAWRRRVPDVLAFLYGESGAAP